MLPQHRAAPKISVLLITGPPYQTPLPRFQAEPRRNLIPRKLLENYTFALVDRIFDALTFFLDPPVRTAVTPGPDNRVARIRVNTNDELAFFTTLRTTGTCTAKLEPPATGT